MAPLASQPELRHQDLTRKFPFFSIIILFFVFLAGPEQNKHKTKRPRDDTDCKIVQLLSAGITLQLLIILIGEGTLEVCVLLTDIKMKELNYFQHSQLSSGFWFLCFLSRCEPSPSYSSGYRETEGRQRAVRHGFCGHREH